MPFVLDHRSSQCLAWLATVAMMVPGSMWARAESSRQVQSTSSKGTTPRSRVMDARLDGRGGLRGRVTEPDGKATPDVQVVVLRGATVIARTRTDREGCFRTDLPGGLYRLQVGGTDLVIRAWPADEAPPQAGDRVDMTWTPRPVARGQEGESDATDEVLHRFGLDGEGGLDPFELTMLSMSIVSLTLAGVTLSRIDSVQDSIDRLPASD